MVTVSHIDPITMVSASTVDAVPKSHRPWPAFHTGGKSIDVLAGSAREWAPRGTISRFRGIRVTKWRAGTQVSICSE